MNILPTQSFNKLQELNQDACQSILEQKYDEAAECLDEAERMLEYAAGCGKTIQRTLITTILNNQACLLQMTSEFQQSSNYLQAIIYNINDFIENCPPIEFSQNTAKCQSEQYSPFVAYIERKIALALYHLRFCALNSHLKNNEVALKSAKKSLELLKQICQQEYNFELFQQRQRQQIPSCNEGYDKINSKNIYKQLSHLKDGNNSVEYAFEMYISKLMEYIQKYQNRILENKEGDQSFQDIFKSYSIGNLMQVSPLPLHSKLNTQQFIKKEFSIAGKLYRIIHMSMAYFTIATELRLISTAKYALNEEERGKSSQFKQSRTYHEISIMLIVKYFPCKCVFFDHVVSSYQNHYGFNLVGMSQVHTGVDSVTVSIVNKSEDQKEKLKDFSNDQSQNHTYEEYNQIMNIPDQKLLEEVGYEAAKNDEPVKKISHLTEVKNKQKIQFKKLKQIKPKNKIQKLQRTSSSKIIQIEKIMPAPQLKNKEDTCKNRLLSKGKSGIKSRSKDVKLITKNSEREQKRGIYYQTTNKSRSKSKKGNILEKSSSKKGLLTAKLGNIALNKKVKQAKIEEEYGIHSIIGHSAKPAKIKVKNGLIRNLHNNQEQNHYIIKFNKVMGREQAGMRKLKSPRTIKKQSIRKQKSVSKDKNPL